jgi:hypothetical protein
MAVNAAMATNVAASQFVGLQYQRNFQLIVSNSTTGLDLSQLHCKFSIKRSSNQTPNTADIKVYNLDESTAQIIQKQFTSVVIQGGYNSNYGVVFKGTIKQVLIGHDNQTDSYIEIVAGDGDLSYNYAVVNANVKAGATQMDILKQVAAPMATLGTTQATNQPSFTTPVLPRGKTMWGSSKRHLRNISDQNGLNWSIQNEQIVFVPQQGYTPGTAIVLTCKTGVIGWPQQTDYGVNVTCLMNPNISPGRAIKIDNASVQGLKLDPGNPNDPVNLAPPLTWDGIYFVLVVETTGDNRGTDWYSKLICATINPASNPINSVPVSYGP